MPADPAEDCFATLGIPPRYQVDLVDAEARFRELSRRFHPDRFARADARARRASLQRSVQLNEAWRTIKDPVRRATYILERAGHVIGDGPAPAALLGEMMELREELLDARQAGDEARVQAMASAVRARVEEALARVARGLADVDEEKTGTGADAGAARDQVAGDQAANGDLTAAGDQATAPGDQARAAVAADLVAIRYFRRFLEEVAVHDEALAASKEMTIHA